MEPFEIMVSESQERMLGGGRAGPGRRGAGGLREMADRRRPRSASSPTAARCGSCAAARSSARCRSRRWSTAARSTTSSPAEPERVDLRQPGDARPPAPRAEDDAAGAARAPPASPPSAGPSSSTTRSSARAPCAGPESADAAVLQIPEAGNAIAVSIDGNGRRVACDPYAGTVEAVLECAQNLACVGAEPLGLTNCLNFGNPEKPAPAWQLDRAVSGLADACKALGVPVVGGNVSLYNEGPEGPIYPTPVVGMVGELPDPAQVAGSAFAAEGDAIALLGPFAPTLAGSELAKQRGELDAGLPAARHRRGRRRLRDRPRRGPRRRARLRPRRQRRRPRLRPGRVGDRRRDRLPGRPRSRCANAAARPRRRCSARAPAASCSAASASALEALGATSIGEVGGTTIEIAAGDRSSPSGSTRPRRLALARRAGRSGPVTPLFAVDG